MKAHKEAKIAKLATGGARQATGAEKIKAMDKRDVHDEILGRNRTKSGVEKHEVRMATATNIVALSTALLTDLSRHRRKK